MKTGIGTRRGFTLLEVLLAIMIGAWLTMSATILIFSMGELWGRGTDERLFDRHVRGVSRFMDGILRDASASASSAGQTSAVWWEEPAGTEFNGEELLTFELQRSPGVLVWPGQALPNVVCSFQLDRDGLFLLWKSRLEADYEDASPRRTRLSPFATDLEYFYYDGEAEPPVWDQSNEPETDSEGVPLVPSRVQITFTYEEESRTVTLVFPQAPSGVPLY
jgi:prepilin-type N-terminal cleavage/methylation domain-containing protein